MGGRVRPVVGRYGRTPVSAVDELPIDVDDDELVAPPVVAVLITHDPGPWFDEVLAGLRAQDYSSLSVLVIDAGSAVDPTERVAAAPNPGLASRRRT